jgi:hypothetical protein
MNSNCFSRDGRYKCGGTAVLISDFKCRHDLIVNSILVENDVRPAMLVQPINYGEPNSSNKKTNEILMNIKKWFPNLIQSENYTVFTLTSSHALGATR